jgi:hypothetical protein
MTRHCNNCGGDMTELLSDSPIGTVRTDGNDRPITDRRRVVYRCQSCDGVGRKHHKDGHTIYSGVLRQ